MKKPKKNWKARFRKNGQIYIIPTQLGLIFMGSFCAMLLIAAAYANNLIYLLAFLLFSIFFVTMVQTHSAIKNLKLMRIEAESGFANDNFVLHIDLLNTGPSALQDLQVWAEDFKTTLREPEARPIPAKGMGRFTSTYQSGERGTYKICWVRLTTRFPLGLFRAWTFIPSEEIVHIYPAPIGQILPAGTQAFSESEKGASILGVEDFQGHRRLGTGEPTRHVDWRAFARTSKLLAKQFIDFQHPAWQFDEQKLLHLDREARLSQLTLWITQAQASGYAYSLRVANTLVPTDSSLRHQVRCLELLAEQPTDESNP